MLLDALQRHKASGAVNAHGWHALTNLSVSSVTKKQIASTSGIKSLISSTLTTHGGAPRVVEGVATTVRNLCDGTHPDQLLESGTNLRLIQLLQKYTQTTLVALALVGAIRSVASDNSHAKQIASLGGREALVACGAAHKDDERLTEEVASALRRLDRGDGKEATDKNGRNSEVRAANKTRMPFGGSTKNVTPGTAKGNLSSRLNPLMSKRKSKGGGDGGMEHV